MYLQRFNFESSLFDYRLNTYNKISFSCTMLFQGNPSLLLTLAPKKNGIHTSFNNAFPTKMLQWYSSADKCNHLTVARGIEDVHGPADVMNGIPLNVATPLSSVKRFCNSHDRYLNGRRKWCVIIFHTMFGKTYFYFLTKILYNSKCYHELIFTVLTSKQLKHRDSLSLFS